VTITRSAPVISSAFSVIIDSASPRPAPDSRCLVTSAAALLGHVQVAVDLVTDPDRHAKKRLHRRARREAQRLPMPGDIGEQQWLGIGDQQTEQAFARGPVVDGHRCLDDAPR
jgi:hypothetical protein